jgi:hypothetical protein
MCRSIDSGCPRTAKGVNPCPPDRHIGTLRDIFAIADITVAISRSFVKQRNPYE